jgi:hypothetical protein
VSDEDVLKVDHLSQEHSWMSGMDLKATGKHLLRARKAWLVGREHKNLLQEQLGLCYKAEQEREQRLKGNTGKPKETNSVRAQPCWQRRWSLESLDWPCVRGHGDRVWTLSVGDTCALGCHDLLRTEESLGDE